MNVKKFAAVLLLCQTVVFTLNFYFGLEGRKYSCRLLKVSTDFKNKPAKQSSNNV